MSVDHTQVVYSSSFSAYQNINVYETTVNVDTSVITPGSVKFWETTVTVEPGTKFATISIQANEFNGSGAATTLKWQSYPSAEIIYVTLTTDPMGNGNLATTFGMSIDDDEVTFSIGVFNPYISNIAFANTAIGVRYASYTVG
jgi:uncharacterized cupredoxin-like copper-binding protein